VTEQVSEAAGKTAKTAPQISKTLPKTAQATIAISKFTRKPTKFNKILANPGHEV
jgi:hypothetical protein